MSLLYLSLFILCAAGNGPDTLSQRDKIIISEAYRIPEIYGKRLWNNWDKTGLIILLIGNDTEYLINHPNPGTGFNFLNYDSLLRSNIFYRKRIFAKNLFAAFPMNGVPVIAAGLPENTGKTPTEWVITIFHEHFHQIQYSQKNYYTGADSLNLSDGDKSGMWMLNYPFPYEDPEVNKEYEVLAASLLNLVQPFPPDSRLFNRNYNLFVSEMLNFKNILNEKDYKYFQFQLWQEGIARYTEYKIADLLDTYRPPDEFESLEDYKSFTEIADSLRKHIYNGLREYRLKNEKRECFFSFGASLGLLLDRVNKDWKEKYFSNLFSMDGLIKK
jgi:hypothetical protein